MSTLPPNVYQALSALPGAVAIPVETTDGETAVICKADAADIASIRSSGAAVSYRYELGLYPEGAVIRFAFQFHDRPDSPFDGECFLNPAGEFDLPLLRHLAAQTTLTFNFYDLRLRYVFTKLVPQRNMVRREIERLTQMALDHNATLAPAALNFVAATYKMQQ